MATRPAVHLRRCSPDAPAPTGPSRLVRLARRAVAAEPLHGGPLEIACQDGALWITLEGAHDDVVLERGQCAVFEGRGLLVIEALSDATAVLRPKAARAA